MQLLIHYLAQLLLGLLRGFSCGLVLMAFTEYATHRWMLHRNTFIRLFPRVNAFHEVLKDHTKNHHGQFFKCFNHEEDPQGKYAGLFFPLGYYKLLWIFVAMPLFFFVDWAVGLGFAGWAYAHYKLWNEFHKSMHFDEPVGRLLRPWFQFVEWWHFLHHQHRNKNFAGLLPPLMDVIFLTLTWASEEDKKVWQLIKSGQVVDRKGRPLFEKV
jgi:hypothetical protein